MAQQTSEKQRLEDEEKHASHLYELKACELDQRAVELAMADEETRRTLNAAHREYNKALVSQTLVGKFGCSLSLKVNTEFCLKYRIAGNFGEH